MQLPEKFSDRMKTMLQDEYEDFARAFKDEPIYRGMRINSLKSGAEEQILSAFLDLEKVLWCDNGYYIDKEILSGKSPYHMGGLVYFQEPSAMSTVEALGINKGDFVLDLCAAPGGKSTQAAEKLSGTGLLVANEIVQKRSLILAENIQRMGIKNAVVTNESPERLAEKYPSFFDKIIVDAPCSGEGMFRKEPQAVTEWSEEHTKSCAVRQKNILKSAFSMLKKGGRLVYSTCTFAPCENEGVADWILSEFDDVKLCAITIDGLSDGKGEYINSGYDLSGTKRIFPHRAKGEGHYVALFEKAEGEARDYIKEYKCSFSDIFREFEKNNLNCKLGGYIINFADKLYLMPEKIDIDKIKVQLPGLFLGVCKKGRFEPSHALCLALGKDDFKSKIELSDMGKYFRGETVPCDNTGWTAVLYNGYPMGWGKASDGVLKNHFPKYLRF